MHDAWTFLDNTFKHLVCFFSWAVKLGTSFNQPTKEVILGSYVSQFFCEMFFDEIKIMVAQVETKVRFFIRWLLNRSCLLKWYILKKNLLFVGSGQRVAHSTTEIVKMRLWNTWNLKEIGLPIQKTYTTPVRLALFCLYLKTVAHNWFINKTSNNFTLTLILQEKKLK